MSTQHAQAAPPARPAPVEPAATAPNAADRAPTREDILAQCIAADAQWAKQPGRNLVLLFDGTGNILGNQQDTNVVKLLRMLGKGEDPAGIAPTQLVYYDPGVGTANEFPADGIVSSTKNRLRQLAGLALGNGVFPNIAEAYRFLVNTYKPGDRIYLFGFSRGAFTARAVSGMINMYGLIHTEGLPLIDTLVRTYFAPIDHKNQTGTKSRKDFAQDVIDNFSLGRTPLVHFVGVWDTVEAIGLGGVGSIKISNSKGFADKRFVHVRHAMSLFESRSKYAPRRYDDPDFTAEEQRWRSYDQRWFRGVHSDVGGSYARDGLSNLTLAWMVDEALAHGLRVDKSRLQPGNPLTAMHDQAYDCPYWVWTGLSAREREASDFIDPTARPVDGAVPAETVPRTKPWRWVGIALAIATAVLFVITALAGRAACDLSAAPGWVKSLPSGFQASAHWHATWGVTCGNTDAVRHAIAWDWALLASYALWLAYPVAWALRRLVARAVPPGRALGWLYRHAHGVMGLLVVSDIVENCITLHLQSPHQPDWPTMLTVATSIKLLSLLLLGWVMVAGALAGREGGRAPASPVPQVH
ncbi:DUF2235 domain-containing protein [Acidovorax sp. LjRoot194]|uniref:DUF2235 domain-containing protein n=1 Tax=Acidovorax sp. LjRoot194 TaxID=3342280 RepID=UPI003ED16A3E